jgi:hypothetical protein
MVSQNGVDPVRNRLDQGCQEVGRDTGCGLLVQLDERELGRAVDRDEQVEPPFLGPDLRDVDVEVADRVALELAPVRLIALHLRQPANPVPLKAAVQRRPGQVWDRGLEGIEAVIERQERVPAEGNHDGLLLDREHA